MRPDGAVHANTLIQQQRQRTNYLSCTEVMTILGKSRDALCRWMRDGSSLDSSLARTTGSAR
jgi:predicted DNA-binding transcriptional regulator AlpA